MYAHYIYGIYLVSNLHENENDNVDTHLPKRVCVSHSKNENYSTQFGKIAEVFEELKSAEACTAVWGGEGGGRDKHSNKLSNLACLYWKHIQRIASYVIIRDLKSSAFLALSSYSCSTLGFIHIHHWPRMELKSTAWNLLKIKNQLSSIQFQTTATQITVYQAIRKEEVSTSSCDFGYFLKLKSYTICRGKELAQKLRKNNSKRKIRKTRQKFQILTTIGVCYSYISIICVFGCGKNRWEWVRQWKFKSKFIKIVNQTNSVWFVWRSTANNSKPADDLITKPATAATTLASNDVFIFGHSSIILPLVATLFLGNGFLFDAHVACEWWIVAFRWLYVHRHEWVCVCVVARWRDYANLWLIVKAHT